MRNKILNKKKKKQVVNMYIELIMSASHEESLKFVIYRVVHTS